MHLSKLYYRKLQGLIIVGMLLASVFITLLNVQPVLGADWWNADWPFRKSITIDHTKVAADLTNFPVLIDITDADLTSKAQSGGDDIAFADSSGVQLNHEIELYDSGTDHLVAWVSVNVSSATNTTLYMYYGNPTASNQENVTGVWGSDYIMAQHLHETSGTHYDSTSNNNNGAPYGGLNQNVAGKIDGADNFDGTNDYVNCSTSNMPATSGTISAWVKPSGGFASQPNNEVVVEVGSAAADRIIFYFKGSTGRFRLLVYSNATGKDANSVVTSWSEEWYYFAGTWDDTSVRLYINGSEDSTPGAGWRISTPTSAAIGAEITGGATSFFNGFIDEVRISETARSASWISTEYNNQNSPSTFYTVGSEESTPGPVVSNPSPSDGETGVSVSLSQLSFNLTGGQPMNYIVTTSPDIGSDSASGVGNGTYTVSVSGLSYYTIYTWHVSVTDGTYWTNKTFRFATEPGSGPWWNAEWLYRKMITINHTKVIADLTNFPVSIDITDADLASKAQNDGDDIAFTNYYGTQLNHEIELYNSGSGRLVSWVNVNSLSSFMDTVLYMYYGNPAASHQENVAGVWGSDFKGVWHLHDDFLDSSGNGNDGTNYGSTDTVGKMADAQYFDGNDYMTASEHGLGANASWTASFWFRSDSSIVPPHAYLYMISTGAPPTTEPGAVNIYQSTETGVTWRGEMRAVIVDSDGDMLGIYEYNGTNYLDNEWHLLHVSWDASLHTLSLYVDGSEERSSTNVTCDTGSGTLHALHIGTRQDLNPDRFHVGDMDEIRISSVTRSASWISTEYNNQYDPSTFYTVGSEEIGAQPEEPVLSNENPPDGASGVGLNPALSIYVVDYQGDLMNITFSTNATGPWQNIGSYANVGNGTYTQTTTNMNSYSTKYWWSVNATDSSGNSTKETYSFTTRPEPGGWWNPDWKHRKNIIIDHRMVTADLTNFPVSIDITDADLASKAQNDGDDIVFTDYNGTQLNHEIELFNGTTGHLVAWVNVASLSSTTDTMLYMYYGNPAASNQENVAGVWNSNFNGVWHLDQTSGGVSAWRDSTSNGYHGTDSNMNPSDPGTDLDAPGKINGAVRFDGVNDTIGTGFHPSDGSRTLEFWVNYDIITGNPNSTSGVGYQAIGCHDGSNHRFYAGIYDGSMMFFGVGNTFKNTTYSGMSAGSWYYIVVTADGSTARYYINGVERDSFSYSQSGSDTDGFHIGSKTIGGVDDSFTDGIIDEVRVSGMARSVGWISTCFNNQKYPSGFYAVRGEESYTDAPSLSDEDPWDDASNVGLNPALSIYVVDYQGDLMNITFSTNATGPWQNIGSYANVGNGTYTQTTTNMNSYSTKYWWSVNATDSSGNSTKETYSFITRPENYAPTVSNPSPSDGETGVQLYLSQLSFTLTDLDGDPMGYIVTTSPDIGSDGATGVYDGTYTVSVSGLSCNITYIWHVNVTDGTTWTNKTYQFTTKETWTLTLKWTASLPSFNRDTRIADINGDGVKEVIRAYTGGVAALWGTNGSVIWSYSEGGVRGDSQIEVADLNKDGIPEVLVTLGVGQGGLLVLHGNNGSLYWRRTDLGGVDMSATPIVFDIDRDGYPTVFTASRRMDGDLDGSRICALSYDGQLEYYSNRVYWVCWGGLSIMDYDNDGHFELYFGDNGDPVLGSGDVVKSFWAENLTVRWVVRPRTSPPILDCSANLVQCIDVTGDGIRDLVIVTRSADADWYGGRTGVAVLSAKDGSLLRYSALELSSVLSTVIYDIDRDGHPEVIGSGSVGDANNYLTVFDLIDWVKEVEIPLTTGARQQPGIGDVTGDGYMEILVPDGSTLRVFNRTYQEIAQLSVPGSGEICYAQVVDFDGDGLNEILVARDSGHVVAYDTDGLPPPGGVRSEMKHFSEYRLGAPEYVTFIALKDEFPRRNSVNQPLNPTLSIDVYNYQGESMTVTFSTNATGTWQVIGTYTGGNGIYSHPTTNMNSPNMTYWWSANVTDGYTWNKVTYKFTTTETPPQTTIQVYPVTTDAQLDEDYTIYINVTNAIDLYAWEFQLDYNQAVLDITSVSVVPGGLNTPTYTYHSLTDEANGHLWWAVSTIHPTTTGISYDRHAIFEIHFHTIAGGASNLGLYGTFLSDPGTNPISHTVVNGSITVTGAIDLTVTSINVLDHGCSIYANDTYVNGTTYYYPVEVTIRNGGTIAAGQFYVKLEVYWVNGSLSEASAEILVSGLAAGTSTTVNFTSLFHPMHTGHYRLTATVDSRNNITESDETNNTLILSDIPVTAMGDVNGDGVVNILDAVIIALAWDAYPTSPQWNICADINHDGHIDILDGVRIGLHWGETW